MKANRALAATLLVSLLAACVAVPPAPPPAPRPAPRPAPAPPPPPPPPADWRNAPATPGAWRWNEEGGRPTASYGLPGGAAVARLSCDRAARATILWRTGSTAGPAPLAVTATGARKVLDGAPDPAGGVSARLPASDPLLDAIAFTRGRFMLEIPGNAPLYLPGWAELGRVIEDCR